MILPYMGQKSVQTESTPSHFHQHLDPEEGEEDDDAEDEDDARSDDLDAVSRPLQRAREWRSSGSGKGKSMASKKPRTKGQQSVLSALLPGSEIRGPTNPILFNTSINTETVIFNIGGTIFETHRSTLRKLPQSPLADESFLRKHFREDKGHYFFDRDPEVFGAILNYLRTGELHLPTKYCGPAVKTEMEFWGIEEDEIEECCWTNYSAWTTTLEALRKLEKDRKDWNGSDFSSSDDMIHMPGSADQFINQSQSPPSKLRQLQMNGWKVLNSPHSGLAAQIYSYVSLTFVVVSIFSFIAQTHEYFRINVDVTPSDHSVNATGSSVNATGSSVNVTGSNETLNASTQAPDLDDLMLQNDVHPAMLYIDAVCLAFFLSEFALRFTLSPRRCKLLLLPMTIFELLALLPDLIEFGVRIFHPTLRTMSAVDVITFLRLLRVFRIFRLMRHFPGLWILFYTLKASVKELLLLLMFLCVGMLFFASLIYYTDNRATFTSIPMACWWSIITMTTVGYGDMYPTTKWGYVVGSMTAICGVLVIGFTVPVLVNNFILYYQHTQCAINREGAKKRRENVKRNMMKDSLEGSLKSADPTAARLSSVTPELEAGCASLNLDDVELEVIGKFQQDGFGQEKGDKSVESVEFKGQNGELLSVGHKDAGNELAEESACV